MEDKRYTLGKTERLCSKKLIERLFAGGNKSFPSFPLRVVYMWVDSDDAVADTSILISVPKKRFKHAVKRNMVKRQVREAYRRNKYLIIDRLEILGTSKKLVMAFIWLDNRIHSTEEVESKVKRLLIHIAENAQ